MKKVKALELNNKWLLIAGGTVILVALLVWGVLGNVYKSNLHGGPLTPLTPLTDIPRFHIKDGPRFVPPNEPVESIKLQKIIEPINTIKEIEGITEIKKPKSISR